MKFINYLITKKFLLFFCMSFLLYGNTLKNGYGIDDQFVTENSYTNKGLRSTEKIFTTYYADDGKNNYEYRPVVKMSFALEHQLFGVKPWIGHLINIILYALCLLLLYKVLLIVFYHYPDTFCLCTTIVFAFLPVHSEVVASLKNRDVLLCFIYCMCVIINLNAFFATNKYRYIVYAAVFSILGFLTKYDLLPFLVIAPLILYKKYKFNVVPILITASVFAIGLILSKQTKHLLLSKSLGQRAFNYYENPLFFNHSIGLKVSAAFNSLGFYLKMLIFPSNMVSYYGVNTIHITDFLSLYAILGIILFALMVFYFFKLFRSQNSAWYAIVFSGISISMYLNVAKPVPGIVGERFMFFSSIGFCIFIVNILFTYLNHKIIPDSFQKINLNFKIGLFSILLMYSFFTVSRNFEWKNRITLYEYDIKKRPESIPLNLLYSNEILVNLRLPSSYFLTEQNKPDYINKAIVSLNNVLKIDSLNTTALNNLAFIKQNIYNDQAGAITYYRKALKTDPAKFETMFNLAFCLYTSGNFAEAEDLILKIYPSHSDNQQVLDLMTYILIDSKKAKKGILIFKELAIKEPLNNNINITLGNFYISLSDTINARKYYSQALKNEPNNQQLIKIVEKVSK